MKHTNPTFSIVIPVYNRADTIQPTLVSVQKQTFKDFECLVIDDGSRDSKQLKDVIEALDDLRFKYLWRENGGGGAARNTGIFAAQGKYIAFLDSDDFFLPHKLDVFSNIISDEENIAYYAPTYVDRGVKKQWIRPERAIGKEEDVGEYLFVQNQYIQTSTIVAKTSIVQKTPFDPELKKGQDLDLCVRLHHAGVQFQMIDEPLTIWVDASETNRASRYSGYQAPMAWLEKSKPLLSEKAYYGYKATVLTYYISWEKPVTAIGYLIQGLFRGGVPVKIICRQFLRSFMPRQLYRKLVNFYIRSKGISG